MKAATAAANVASAGESATAACAVAAGTLPALPVTSVIAGVPAAEPDTAPGRRGARDRVVRRSPGPSVALMTRAYVSVIASHAAPY